MTVAPPICSSVAGDVVPQNAQTSACFEGFQCASAPQAGQWNSSRAEISPAGSPAWGGRGSVTVLLQEFRQRCARDAPLRADLLALQIAGFQRGHDVRLREAQRRGGFGGPECLRNSGHRVRRAAGGRRGLRGDATLLVHHLLRDRHADRQFGARARDARSAGREPLGHLILHEVVQVADRRHARPLVDRLLDLRRDRHVLDHEARHLDAVLADENRIDDGQQRLAELAVARGDVEHGHFAGGERLAEDTHETRAHRVGKLIEAEMMVGARHFLQEPRRIGDAEVVGAERPDPDDAEVLVAHHHWIRRAPFVAGEQARDDVIDVRLERRLETVLPALEARQDRNVVRRQRVLAGPERIAELAQVHELRDLGFADNELRAALDFLVLVRPSVRQGVARIVGPLDDFNELAADEVRKSHCFLLGGCSAYSRSERESIHVLHERKTMFTLERGLEILERTPAILRVWLDGLSPAWVEATEGPGTWSPYDVVGHLIHGERTDWMARVRVIVNGGGTFQKFDRFAQFEESRGKSLSQLLDEFAEARRDSLAELRALNFTEADLDRTGTHPAFGAVTLRQLLSTWVAHDLDHLMQISRVMGKQLARDVGPWVEYLRIARS